MKKIIFYALTGVMIFVCSCEKRGSSSGFAPQTGDDLVDLIADTAANEKGLGDVEKVLRTSQGRKKLKDNGFIVVGDLRVFYLMIPEKNASDHVEISIDLVELAPFSGPEKWVLSSDHGQGAAASKISAYDLSKETIRNFSDRVRLVQISFGMTKETLDIEDGTGGLTLELHNMPDGSDARHQNIRALNFHREWERAYRGFTEEGEAAVYFFVPLAHISVHNGFPGK